MKFKLASLCVLTFIFISTLELKAQQTLTVPRESQMASVMQRIGITDIKINYHRPGVKNRVVWGVLVPYNEVWRAGANENTTISFTHPVKIEGKDLPAGTYGLHMIPTENEWTIIFSKNNWSWGSFFYDEKEDELRIKVKPSSADFKEWLEYYFDDSPANKTQVVMHWEKLKVSFQVEVDVPQVVLNNFKKELENAQGFTWQAFNQAANYALRNNINLDEALAWSDRSIGFNRNFNNLWTKAELLQKKGNNAEAEKIREETMQISTENDINTLGYQYLSTNQIDKAIEIFKKNVKDYPDSWNVWDSLGEGYAVKGEKKLAIENYRKALEMVQDDVNKKRINNILKGLEGS